MENDLQLREILWVYSMTSLSPSLSDMGQSDTGWRRLVGSSKLYVSFAEYRLFYRALLQKRRVILRSLRIVASPYVGCAQKSKPQLSLSLSLSLFLSLACSYRRNKRAREREREREIERERETSNTQDRQGSV